MSKNPTVANILAQMLRQAQGPTGVQGPTGSQGSQGGPSRLCLSCHSPHLKRDGNDFPPEIDSYHMNNLERDAMAVDIGNTTYCYHFVWLRQGFIGNPFGSEPVRIRFRFKCADCGFEWDELSCYPENY